MKVAVYGSARNEEKNVDAWLASTEGADVVAVNDTGSTDSTVAKFTRAETDAMIQISQLPVEPMTLSNALNIVLDTLPDDVDLAIRLDLDERLQPGWRTAVEKAWADHDGGALIVRPWFDHQGWLYRHTRAHSRHGFEWQLPVHEILVSTTVPATIVDAEFTIEHHQDLTKDRSQVLGELQAALAADPTNQRLQHYLGREYTYRADWQSAIPLLRQHAESDAFPEERSESWRLLGDCYVMLMAVEDVPLRPFRMAAETCPERREGWVVYSDLCRQQGRWLESLEAAERALTITERNWYGNLPFAWGGEPWHLAALASWFLGRAEQAARYGRRAVELEPDNELYAANLGYYEGVRA